MVNVLVNVSSPEDYNLFKRFSAALGSNFSFCYVANNLPVYLVLKAKNESVWLPKVKGSKKKNLEENFSVKTGRLSLERAGRVYAAFYDFLIEKSRSVKFSIVILPSGRLSSQHGLSDAAKELGIKKVYTGYGNVDNRIFVDSQGTDKQSSLFLNPEILDSLPVDEPSFARWKEDYISRKKVLHKVSQAKKIGVKTFFLKFVQIFFCKIEKILGFAGENDYGFSELLKVKPVAFSYDKMDFKDEYIFFPMQVSTDAQVILNFSGGSVLDGLAAAIEFSRSKGKLLVVKPHPAELNQRILIELNRLKENSDFKVVNDNTFVLLENSEEVVTINSTVALEAMLFNKPVTFLGDSFYQHLNPHRLMSYVSQYLIDEDYFSSEPIRKESALKLLDRAK